MGPKSLTQQGPANLDGIKFIVTRGDSVRVGACWPVRPTLFAVQAYDEKQATDRGYKIYAAPTRGVNDSISFRPDNPLVSDIRVRRRCCMPRMQSRWSRPSSRPTIRRRSR